MPQKVVRVSHREAIQIIKELTEGLSGRLVNDIHRAFWSGLAYYFMDRIHKAFMVCSEGRTDEFGRKWKKLDKRTIAYSKPITLAEKQKRGLGRGHRYRGLLTSAEDKLWRGIFAKTYTRLVIRGYSHHEASQLAGQLAWAILKNRGAKTKLSVYGRRKVPILITSHTLEKSLRPGQLSKYSYRPPHNQICTFEDRRLTVGTSVPYADKLDKTRKILPNINVLVQRHGTKAIDFALNRVLDLL